MSDQPPKEGNKKAQHTPTERRTWSSRSSTQAPPRPSSSPAARGWTHPRPTALL